MPGPIDARANWRPLRRWLPLGLTAALLGGGCTSFSEYLHNGLKVGPNYQKPPAAVADDWIDGADSRLRKVQGPEIDQWWTVFNDPVLNRLIGDAYRQNLPLREAGFRVLQARAELGIAIGEFFPQQQFYGASLTQTALSTQVANRQFIADRFYSQWTHGLSLAWELDFWGKFRRQIESAEDHFDASIENYDAVLVSLLGEVGLKYILYRQAEEQMVIARENATLQQQTLTIAEGRFKGGLATEVDVMQAKSDLNKTLAEIPRLQIIQRGANNRLCLLLGIPSQDLAAILGQAGLPATPREAIVGLPADLLRRRPDVREAERKAAAECARIGVAVSDLYPQISISGNVGYTAEVFGDLFTPQAFAGNIGPGFRWNILEYGRLLNNIRRQDAKFSEAVVNFQNTVLKANEEVEDGLNRFLRSQERARFLEIAATAELTAVKEAIAQYKGGMVDFNRVAVIQERLLQRQLELVEARSEAALGLVLTYRALGGGWQIRCTDGADATASTTPSPGTPTTTPPGNETLPLPRPQPVRPPQVTP